MIQLDLFGEPIIKKSEENTDKKLVQPLVTPANKEQKNESNFIFSDDKIGVKIKQKPKPIIEIVNEPQHVQNEVEVTAEPIIIDVPINEQVQPSTAKEAVLAANNVSGEEIVALPTVADELEAVKHQLASKEVVTPNEAKRRPLKPDAAELNKRGRKSFKDIDAEVHYVEVPNEETLFQKQYYNISTVADWFHVNTSLIRYWENEFDILKPRKNRKGDRLFRPEDVKNLQVIYYLLRQRKFSIEGAKQYLKDNKKTIDTNMLLMQTLQQFKSFLLELKANIQA